MRQMVGCMLRCVVGAKPFVEWAKKSHADDIEFYTNGHGLETHGTWIHSDGVGRDPLFAINSCLQLLMMSCKKKWP